MDTERRDLAAYEYLCHIGEAKEYHAAFLMFLDGLKLAQRKILQVSRRCLKTCEMVSFLQSWDCSFLQIHMERYLRLDLQPALTNLGYKQRTLSPSH
jgi:hypothetical protein